MIGKLQYAASLYWLRGTPQSKMRARFDYTMAMAAVCGLSAPEITGKVSCSGIPSVKEGNPRYLELCKYLDLPTLKDLAVLSARRLLTQWSEFEPDKFDGSGDEIVGVRARDGTLLSDLYNLSKETVNDWYPEYHKEKRKPPHKRKHNAEDIPEWKRVWSETGAATRFVFKTHAVRECGSHDKMNTFWLENRRRFRVLEKHDRAMKRLDIEMKKACKRSANVTRTGETTPAPPSKRSRKETPILSRQQKRQNDDFESKAKKQKFDFLSCSSAMPIRPGRTSPNACWICGYRVVAKKDRRNFGCCKRFSHNACWKRQFLLRAECPLTKGAKCCQVSNYLKKDRFTVDSGVKTVKTPVENPTDGMNCDLCHEDLSEISQDSAVVRQKSLY